MVGEAEDRRALGRLVAADALEDAGAVVEAVRADVDLASRPVDELAVHPDLLGLAPCASSGSRDVSAASLTASTVSACASRTRSAGESVGHVLRRAGADPDALVRRAAGGRRGPGRPSAAGTARRRPGAKPGRVAHLVGARDPRFGIPAARATLRESARRSPGTITTHGLPSQSNTSDLTICPSLQPTACAASSAVGVPAANSSIRASAPLRGERRPRARRRSGQRISDMKRRSRNSVRRR